MYQQYPQGSQEPVLSHISKCLPKWPQAAFSSLFLSCCCFHQRLPSIRFCRVILINTCLWTLCLRHPLLPRQNASTMFPLSAWLMNAAIGNFPYLSSIEQRMSLTSSMKVWSDLQCNYWLLLAAHSGLVRSLFSGSILKLFNKKQSNRGVQCIFAKTS